MKFKVEFTTTAVRELKKLTVQAQKAIIEDTIKLEKTPFPYKKKVKRIQGMKFPCYRLRIDTASDSFRLFYGIEQNVVYVLRIVPKKDSEKIIKSIKKSDFPPDIPQ